MCIDYRKLNKATKKDHFPLPFIDKKLECLVNHSFFCFLDGYSRYHQILIHPDDQSKTTFTCPYGTYAYRRMSFRLCNAPASFQRCMMSIFSDMIEKIMEVFMDDFTVYGKTFSDCLENSLHRLFGEFKQGLTTVRRKAFSPELGEMPFYGLGRNTARIQGVRPWDRGGQSKD